MAQLTLDKLSKHFGKVIAVNGISITVQDGEFVCILGPSGCGKSTVLRMIAGFETPTAGDIRIDDTSISYLPANKRPTAMVFQQYTLWPHMAVYDNIAFGLKLRGMSKKDIERKVEEGLALVGLTGYKDRYPQQLSGGQQQRIALARAVVLEPKILLLDEPFSSLDALLRVRLREELKRIQRNLGITTIFVTHDQEEALSLADRIAVMNTGQIEQLDEPTMMYANPRTLFAADFIGAMNLLEAEVNGQQLIIGGQTLESAEALNGNQQVKVGIRPEDFAILPDTSEKDAWTAGVEQIMDMGHYLKILVNLPGIEESVKIYTSKSIAVSENTDVRLYPLRYLIYRADEAPIEVQRQLSV